MTAESQRRACFIVAGRFHEVAGLLMATRWALADFLNDGATEALEKFSADAMAYAVNAEAQALAVIEPEVQP